jgi:hypothetical protein
MKWVTRKNASVDRIACPWLVRRFIDPEAEFLYVPAADVVAVAERATSTAGAASSRSSSSTG